MPLTPFQREVSRLLAVNRTPDSHLGGGSEERVAKAFADDRALLESRGIRVSVQLAQPGYIRALAGKGEDCTKIEWAHDSAWRFMPPVKLPEAGYALHPVDLAVNKVLALAGRDEPRDFLDALYAHDEMLPLPALLWAAVGKDPGFTPLSLLELVKRRGRYQPVDFERLRLVEPVRLEALKAKWLAALGEADRFVRSRPSGELGCLYYSPGRRAFLMPGPDSPADLAAHFGRPGGVLPELYTGDALADSFS